MPKLANITSPCNLARPGPYHSKLAERKLQSNSELELFSTVVEKIYDASVDTSRWKEALEGIVDLAGGSGAAINFGDASATNMAPLAFCAVGLSDQLMGHMAEFASIWALQIGMPFWKVGDVHHVPDIIPREELINSRFYKEVISKHNQCDFMGMMALREGPHFVPFTVSTDLDVGPFSKRGVEIVRLLSPHICRASKIGLALELKTLNNQRLENTLDALAAGVYLIGRDGKILFMNQAAESQIKRNKGLGITNNRLIPKDATAALALAKALNSADVPSGAGISIALPDALGGLVATLLPLENGERQNLSGLSTPAAFAVFVQDPAFVPPAPGEAFAQLYGLTASELRVFLAMAPSLSPQEAADNLGLSITTVKSHLQHIFTKTGTNKQSDLMQLLMRASAPVAAQ